MDSRVAVPETETVRTVPPGRRPGMFLAEFVGTLALLLLSLVVLAVFRDSFSAVALALFVFLVPITALYLANVVSVPEVSDAAFLVRYGPWTRHIQPERVRRVRIGGFLPVVHVFESGRPMNYRIGLGTFTDGDGLERAIRSWAATNGVTVVG